MNRNYTLDEFDYRLIKAFKKQNVSLLEIKEIWSERCALDIEFCCIKDINFHLLALAKELDLLEIDFIMSLNPSENLYYICSSRPYLKRDTKDFDLVLLSRLDSLFSLTKIVDLPGYKEMAAKSKEKTRHTE